MKKAPLVAIILSIFFGLLYQYSYLDSWVTNNFSYQFFSDVSADSLVDTVNDCGLSLTDSLKYEISGITLVPISFFYNMHFWGLVDSLNSFLVGIPHPPRPGSHLLIYILGIAAWAAVGIKVYSISKNVIIVWLLNPFFWEHLLLVNKEIVTASIVFGVNLTFIGLPGFSRSYFPILLLVLIFVRPSAGLLLLIGYMLVLFFCLFLKALSGLRVSIPYRLRKTLILFVPLAITCLVAFIIFYLNFLQIFDSSFSLESFTRSSYVSPTVFERILGALYSIFAPFPLLPISSLSNKELFNCFPGIVEAFSSLYNSILRIFMFYSIFRCLNSASFVRKKLIIPLPLPSTYWGRLIISLMAISFISILIGLRADAFVRQAMTLNIASTATALTVIPYLKRKRIPSP